MSAAIVSRRRPTFGVCPFEAGVSLRWIQKFLGHNSLQTTLVYRHLTFVKFGGS